MCDFVAQRPRFHGAGRGGRSFEALVGDESGTVMLKWFRGGDAIAKLVRKDTLLLVTGDVTRYRFSKQLSHPEIEFLAGPDAAGAGVDAPRSITPDYATPEGVHPRALRRAVGSAVPQRVQ